MNAVRMLLRGVTRFNDWLGRAVLAYLVLAMFALLFLEVIMRYGVGAPTVWTAELTQMLFGAYAMLAGAYIMAHNAHANVDIFYARFPRRVQAAVDVFTSFLFFAFILVLLTEGYTIAADSVSRLETSHSAWNAPVWPVKLTIPIGAGLLFLEGVVKLIHDILVLFDLEGSEPLFPEDHEEKEQL
ncbi:TRAP transporter small permease subunit [Aquisalimonas lutea]|uniref:TRAP transporter small permease subunit n=1 Tax=Aquisalimonas lutea TaxID=1327750 RepID=UPI0025B2E3D7|nr:TRAP transporter small permease subunit [Aquisalimonas lutea]MDN3517716.1 TRAP transporter small permease subunit [Aquisalimonas lutea]